MNQRNFIIGGVIFLAVILAFVGLRNRTKNSGPNTEDPTGGVSAAQLFEQAAALRKNGSILEAKTAYQRIVQEQPDYEQIEKIQKELEDVNTQIIFSNIPTDETVIHEVKSGDTLGKLAKQYNTTVELIKISNNLKSNVIRVGQKLRVWTGTFKILVDKSQNILILKNGDEVVKVYRVSTGENNSTPVGEFSIVNKLVDPVWFNRGVVVPPESPANVLGSRWLGFDLGGYGIHGTIEPETIGQQLTAGCVRMRNSDVEELYSLVPTGTKVAVVD